MALKNLFKVWQAEPAVIVGAAQAVMLMLVGLHIVTLTAEQIALVMGAFIAVGTVLVRSTVFAPDTVEKLVGEQPPGE